jgi:hypothetical protein
VVAHLCLEGPVQVRSVHSGRSSSTRCGMRSTSPPSCPGKSPPGRPPAPRSGPGLLGSRPGNHLKTSTSIASPASNATPSRIWPPGRSSPKRPTSSYSGRRHPAKPTSRPGSACGPPSSVTGSCSSPPSTGSSGSWQPTKADGSPWNGLGCSATG